MGWVCRGPACVFDETSWVEKSGELSSNRKDLVIRARSRDSEIPVNSEDMN